MSPRFVYVVILGALPLLSTAQNADTALARTLSNEGWQYRVKGDYSKALTDFLQVDSIRERLKPDSSLGRAWLDVAQVFKDMSGQAMTPTYTDRALDYCHNAYGLFRDLRDTSGMIGSLNMIGTLLRDKARNFNQDNYYDTAFVAFTTAIGLMDAWGKSSGKTWANVYNNISQVYIERKKDYKAGLAYLFKAVAANEASKSVYGLTFNYGNISHAYQNMHDFPNSLLFARKMLQASQELKEPERIQNAYFALYVVYQDVNKWDSALHYYILAADLNDSLTNVQKGQQVSELQTKFDTEKKEAQIALLQTERRGQNRKIASLLAAALLLAGFTGCMIWLYRRVRRQREQIAEQSLRLEVMMKELHHRVKNNLQVVSSLLSLQSYDLMDERAVSALRESQLRVQAMSLIHQRLYKKDALTTVNMKEYLTDLAESLLASYGFDRDGFDLEITAHPDILDVDKALPLGLIINEMVTNALKYAYSTVSRPALVIRITEDARQLVCQVRDNGIGMDLNQWNQKTNSFGKQLITALCRQLRAEQVLAVDGGTQFTLTIPKQAA